MKTVFCFLVAILILSSCNINKDASAFSKRKYMPRFKQEGKLAKQAIVERKNKDYTISSPTIDKENTTYASVDIPPFSFQKTPPLPTLNANSKIEKCDEIIFLDGTIIEAKIVEIGVAEIKYKKCDNLAGPAYFTQKKTVFMIKYSDGTTEVLKKEEHTHSSNKNAPTTTPSDTIPLLKRKIDGAAFLSFAASGLSALIYALNIRAPVFNILNFFLAFSAGTLGVILGFLGIKNIKKDKENVRGYGFALPAIIVGVVFAFLSSIWFVLVTL